MPAATAGQVERHGQAQIQHAHRSGGQGAHVELALGTQVDEAGLLGEGEGQAGENQRGGLGQGLDNGALAAEGAGQDGAEGLNGVVAAHRHDDAADDNGDKQGENGQQRAIQLEQTAQSTLFHAVPSFSGARLPPVISRPISMSLQVSGLPSATIRPP